MKRTIGCLALFAAAPAFALMEPATPESQGVPSGAILKFVDACEKAFDAGPAGALHGFVIVRHGKTIAEGSWKPFDTLNETHMLYSHSKSFTSTAVGLAVDEGRLDLDERVVEIFSNEAPAQVSGNLAQLRVRDLLTMNAGKRDHLLRDGGDWVREFLSSDFAVRPGTRFRYDSDATYLLAAIVERKSGRKMMDYLGERVFDRIGITRAWTTFSPQGVPCGGWGMNMTTRELARFGQLYLNRGEWEGTRILSPEWVALATARQTWCNGITIDRQTIGSGSDWNQGYGFQFWRCRHGAYRADGASGQYTVVSPEKDLVVSIHAGLGDMQKELNLVWDHLLPACGGDPLPEDPARRAQLADRLAKLEIRLPSGPARDSVRIGSVRYGFKPNARGFTSLEIAAERAGARLCRLGTRAGRQEFPAGTDRWRRGRIRIDTEGYEGLGAYIGAFDVAARCFADAAGRFCIRAYLTGTTGSLEFAIDASGRLTGEFRAMNGCRLESAGPEAK